MDFDRTFLITMTTLIAWGNINTSFPFHEIPTELVPANLIATNNDNPRVQQRWQCRRLAHFLLWQLLKTSQKPTALLGRISRTERGRPQFPLLDIDFNISHSGDWVAVILHINENGEKSAAHFAHHEEICWFQQQLDAQSEFYRIWCLREAILKSQGIGIVKLSEVIHHPETLQLHSAYCPRGQLIFSDNLPFYLAFFVNQNTLTNIQYFTWHNDRLKPQTLLHKIHYDVNI